MELHQSSRPNEWKWTAVKVFDNTYFNTRITSMLYPVL